MPDLQEQAAEIRRICGEAGISWEEMADRIAVKRDSMRKIVHGYQPASDPLMQSIRNAATLVMLQKGGDREGSEEAVRSAAQTKSYVDDREIKRIVDDLVFIRQAQPQIFKSILNLVKSHRNALAQAISSSPEQQEDTLLDEVAAEDRRPVRVSPRKPPAGAPGRTAASRRRAGEPENK